MPINIEIKEVEDVLNEIKEVSLQTVKEEFKQLLQDAFTDSSDFIKKTAERVATWTVLLGSGQLNRGQYERLLKDQKSLAEQHVNTVQIAVRSRVQKIAYRLLDIAIDILSKAIIIP